MIEGVGNAVPQSTEALDSPIRGIVTIGYAIRGGAHQYMSLAQMKPPVVRVRDCDASALLEMEGLLGHLAVHTVCESACCPNQVECFGRRTATFMILGDVCTRGCAFCAVKKGRPVALESEEADRVVEAVRRMGLAYVVLTSVTRDDLADGGAAQFAHTTRLLRKRFSGIRVEVLVPDFKGSSRSLQTVLESGPAVLGHNIETVPRLYANVRPRADYRGSLDLIRTAKQLSPAVVTKSALMLGLGEEMQEVLAVLRDLNSAGCDVVAIGQYLAPSPRHHPVLRYVSDEEFRWYGQAARDMGFSYVSCGPLVRSSYRAHEAFCAATGSSSGRQAGGK